MDPFIGQIQSFGFNFAPRGWSTCDGQILSISQNTALFSLLGATFGGDGRTTFGLPDLRGRSAVHVGNGPGLSSITWGEKGGQESITLQSNHLPPHTHTAALYAESAAGTSANPKDNMFGGSANTFVSPNASLNRQLSTESIVVANNSTSNSPVGLRDPFLGIYTCIALTGIFPSRS
jgi:microcystin-dependent protein